MKTHILSYLLLIPIFHFFFIDAIAQDPQWQWVRQAGGEKADEAYHISIVYGIIYIEGQFYKTTNIGGTEMQGESWNRYAAEISSDGTWGEIASLGPSKEIANIMIEGESPGIMYKAWKFGTDIEFDSEVYRCRGDYDYIIYKEDPDHVFWKTHMGGAGRDEVGGMALDRDGNLFVAGRFAETAQFGNFTLTSSGEGDIFFGKIDRNGQWVWVKKGGGSYADGAEDIAIDADGNLFITGYFQLDATFGSQMVRSTGSQGYADLFVAKTDNKGNWLWVKTGGGDGADNARGVAAGSDGSVYITGTFSNMAHLGSRTLNSAGNIDLFVAKLDGQGNWKWAIRAGGAASVYSNSIAVDDDGSIYITGYSHGNAMFGNHPIKVDRETDIFVAKLKE